MIRYTQDRMIVLGMVPVRRDMFPPEPSIALKDRVVKRFEEMAESNGDIRLVTIDAVVDGGMLWDLRDVGKVVDLFRAEKVDAIVFPHCNFGQEEVVGTYKTAYAALKHGTQRFVLISTDKAVNPTSIMGASKRLCEMVIQSMDAVSKEGRVELLPFLYAHVNKTIDGQVVADPVDHIAVEGLREEKSMDATREGRGARTQFVAVRFGNVLGSNGSVIPLFKKQIEAGGPVTVTHPDIVRYFMTIPEAVSLVMQAGTYAKGGEIFVLDMGDPVKIDMLARNLIKLSGYEPGVDIQMAYTGLRPGEKLFEEKLMAEEGMLKTDNELIHIGKPIPFDKEVFLTQLEELAEASYENSNRIIEMVEEIVTTFRPVGDKPTGNEVVRKSQGGSAMVEAAVTKQKGK